MTRQEARAIRREIPERLQKGIHIARHLLSWMPQGRVLSYYAIGDEVPTAFVNQQRSVYLPRATAKGVIVPILWDPDTPLSPDAYGIPSPQGLAVPLQEIDLILVPGLAFDPYGNRLGQGGGCYDRLLEGFQGLSCGVCYEGQIVAHLPVYPHDRPVQMLATEMGVRPVERSTFP